MTPPAPEPPSPPPLPALAEGARLRRLSEVKSALRHRLNLVNASYISATHLLALLAWVPFLYAPEGFRGVMGLYLLCHAALALLSTTAYAHRLVSHGATKRISWPVHVLFGYIGQTLAAQGSLASWAGKHRVHHAVDGHARHDEDPYSAVWFESAWRNFVWSHVLCYFFDSPHEEGVYAERAEAVLKQNGVMRLQHRYYVVFLLVMNFLTPLALGALVGGSLWAGLCLMWTAVLACVVVQNVTWSVNSFTHMWGAPAAKSSAKNNYVWLLPLGEGNHHADHHDAPTDYRNGFGLLGWLSDPTRYVLLSLRALRLVGPLQRATRATELRVLAERRLATLAALAQRSPAAAREALGGYEERLMSLKARALEHAQRAEQLQRERVRLLSRRASMSRAQLKEQLFVLKVEWRRARSELRHAWEMFLIEALLAGRALRGA